MKKRKWRAALSIAPLLIAATDCAAANPAAGPAPSGMAMPAAPGGGPSASATMVCGPEIRADVRLILGLPAPPPTTATWADHVYTCVYRLPVGPLVLSVRESPDAGSARGYFEGLRATLGPTRPLAGLAGLGQPGYATPTGTVVVLKDNKTLRVDATRLPAQLGKDRQSPAELAYEVAADVLACWTGK